MAAAEDGWIQTATLKKFFPMMPRPEDIFLEDIATALAHQCRFTGHTRVHYSVAQHSVLVSACAGGGSRELARWGLLHDASEAYLADLPRPLKRLPEFAAYRAAKYDIMRAVAERFGLEGGEPEAVRVADRRMCYTEARDLFSGTHPDWQWQAEPFNFKIDPWAPGEARRRFKELFFRLWPRWDEATDMVGRRGF